MSQNSLPSLASVAQHGRVPLAPSAGLPAGAHTMYAIKTNSVEPTLTLGNPGPIDPNAPPASQQPNNLTPTSLFPLNRQEGGQVPWPVPNPMPPFQVTVKDMAALQTGDSENGVDLTLVDQYLSLLTGTKPIATGGSSGGRGPAGGSAAEQDDVTGRLVQGQAAYPNLARLSLDRETLEAQGVATHQISRLHNLLHAHASAFGSWLAAEQRRLGSLLATKDGATLADRLLLMLTGGEVNFLEDVPRTATDGPSAPNASPERWPGPKPGTAGEGEDEGEGAVLRRTVREPDISTKPVPEEWFRLAPEEVMDETEIAAMAAAGNIVGMRRLLHRYREVHIGVRGRLEGRLKHETARAQRLQDKLDATNADLEATRDQLDEQTQNFDQAQLRVAELEQALAAEQEVVVAERALNESLREEITQLEAQWAAQQAETVARVTEQLEMLASQAEGQLDLREQYLERVKELVMLQLRYDHESRKSARLDAELNASRAAADAAETEAAGLRAWRGRLEQRAEAAEGWAVASKASVAELRAALAKEKEAHRRTKDLLHAIRHKVEAARCAAADISARASAKVREQAGQIKDLTEIRIKLEKQLQEAKDLARIRTFEADNAKMSQKAARDQLAKLQEEFAKEQAKRCMAEANFEGLQRKVDEMTVEIDQLKAALAEAKFKASKAEARVRQLELELAELREWIAKKEEHEAEMERMKQALHAREAEVAELKRKLEAAEAEIARLKEVEEAYEKLRAEHRAMQVQLEAEKAALIVAKSTIEQLRMEVDEGKAHIARLKAEVESLKAKLEETQRDLSAAKEQIDTLNRTLFARETELQGVRGALEEERKRTTALRQEIEELSKLHGTVRALKQEISDLEQKLAMAEAARAQALAERQFWLRTRQEMEGGLQEFLAAAADEAETLRELSGAVQAGMSGLEGSMLALARGDEPQVGEPSPLATVDAALARTVASDLASLTHRLEALLDAERRIRSSIVQAAAQAEAGVELAVERTAPFWREALEAARADPEGLRSHIMTAASSGSILDPASPLVELIPVGMLEIQAKDAKELRARIGALRAELLSAGARAEAAEVSLAEERESAEARQKHWTELVADLRKQIAGLEADLTAALGGRALAENMAAAVARKLGEAEFQVIKAKERESTLGLKGIVPLKRVDRGVQTVYSEMWVNDPPSTAAEAGRRATSTAAYSSWGAALGSGSVALPPMLVPPGAALGAGSAALAATVAAAVSQQQQRPSTAPVPSLAAGSPASAGASGSPPPPYLAAATANAQQASVGLAAKAMASSNGPTTPYGPRTVPANRPATAGPAAAAGGGSGRLLTKALSGHASRPASGVSTISTPSRNSAWASRPTTASTLATQSSPRSPAHRQARPQTARLGAHGPGLPRPHTAHTQHAQQLQQQAWASPAWEDAWELGMQEEEAAEVEEEGVYGLEGVQEEEEGLDGWGSDGAEGQGTGSGPQAQQGGSYPAAQGPKAGPGRGIPGPLMPLSGPMWRPGSAMDHGWPFNQPPQLLPTSPARWTDPWVWAPDVAPLVPSAQALPLQATMDLVADVYRAHAMVAAVAAEGGWQVPELQDFVGEYVDFTYGPEHGPRPLPPLAQLIASVKAHAGVYEVQVFGRAIGVLPIPAGAAQAAAAAVAAGGSGGGAGPAGAAGFGSGAAAAAALRQAAAAAAAGGSAPGSPSPCASASRPLTAISPTHSSGSPQTASPSHRASSARLSSTMPLSRRQQQHQGPAAGLALVPLRQSSPAAGVSLRPHKQRPSTANPASHAMRASTGSPGVPPASPGGSATALALRPSSSRPPTAGQRRLSGRGSPPAGPSSPRGRNSRPGSPQKSMLEEAEPPPPLWPWLSTPEVSATMAGLTQVMGAEDVVRLVASGHWADALSLPDLGRPLLEMAYPNLHFLVSEAAQLLGLELAPELFEHPLISELPAPAYLLQLPHVSGASLASTLGGSGGVAGRLPRLPDGSFGWRRRGVLLVKPGVAEALEAAGQQQQQQVWGSSNTGMLFSGRELQAALAMALAPMCLPGGGGWRLAGTSSTSSAPGVGGAAATLSSGPGGISSNVGAGGAAAVGPSSVTEGNAGLGPGGVLAAADAVTAVTLADLAPQVLFARMPVQLRSKWDRVYRALARVPPGCAATADRAALLVVQQLEPVAAAVWKSVTGVTDPSHCPPVRQLLKDALRPAEPLPLALVDMRAPLDAPPPPADLHLLALARIARLVEWAGSRECGALLAAPGASRSEARVVRRALVAPALAALGHQEHGAAEAGAEQGTH